MSLTDVRLYYGKIQIMNIKFLISSDIHGYLFDHLYFDNKPIDKGLLKIASYFKANKDDNTIVIDNGDTIEGSPILKYFMANEKGDNLMKIALDYAYDYVNIGNHDFNYGSEYLSNYLNSLKEKCICGNVFYKGNRLGEEYIIKNIGGKKIALIGCTTSFINVLEKKENLKDIEIIDEYEFVKKTIEKVKDVDLKVVIYHGGLNTNADNEYIGGSKENQGYEMCRDLDIDILISGHQHRSISYKCFNTYVSQCKSNGDEFVEINYDFDSKDCDIKLLKPKNDIDSELLKYYLPYEEKTQLWIDEVIGSTDYDLTIKNEFNARLNKAPIVSFINQIQKEYTGADLSACSIADGATGFKKNITLRDLLLTYVYPNNLLKVKIDGKTLKKYLEKCAEYFDIENDEIVVAEDYLKPIPKGFNYDMVDGIDYTIDISKNRGSRIIELKYQGKDIKDDDIFTLAINNFRKSGAFGFDMMKDLEVLSTSNEEIVDIIYNYLTKHKNIVINHKNNIKVVK